jgi:hypothetical protein
MNRPAATTPAAGRDRAGLTQSVTQTNLAPKPVIAQMADAFQKRAIWLAEGVCLKWNERQFGFCQDNKNQLNANVRFQPRTTTFRGIRPAFFDGDSGLARLKLFRCATSS